MPNAISVSTWTSPQSMACTQVITEWGVDSFDNTADAIDEQTQASFLSDQWAALISPAASGYVSSGGIVFEWTDEPWKGCPFIIRYTLYFILSNGPTSRRRGVCTRHPLRQCHCESATERHPLYSPLSPVNVFSPSLSSVHSALQLYPQVRTRSGQHGLRRSMRP